MVWGKFGCGSFGFGYGFGLIDVDECLDLLFFDGLFCLGCDLWVWVFAWFVGWDGFVFWGFCFGCMLGCFVCIVQVLI